MKPFIHNVWARFANKARKHYVRIMYATTTGTNKSYNARLAAQIIAYFALKNSSRKISVLKVVKLVYLSDRKNMELHGFPILTERRVSMLHGPVNSQTYNNIKQDPSRSVNLTAWTEFVTSVVHNKIGAVPNVSVDDLDEFSDSDVEVLDKIWKQFGHMTPSQIRQWTHDNCPEYEDVERGAKTIKLITLASKSGLTREQYDRIVEQESIDNAFASIA